MKIINLATEDELSEAVGLRLIGELPSFELGISLPQSGNGYLRSNLKSFCEMARQTPMLMMTDLDGVRCAPSLITAWIGGNTLPAKLFFRVVVREIEAWLMADHDAMIQLMGASISGKLAAQPETLPNPKETLLELAKKAPRDVKADLLPTKGAIAGRGLGYNTRLCQFVRETWDPARAATRSDSLRRTRARLQKLET